MLELWVALRFLGSTTKTMLFNPGSRMALFFMALMVFIMVLVLAIFTGFQQEVRSSLWNSGNHITIKKKKATDRIANHEQIAAEILEKDPRGNVRQVYGSISLNVLLNNRNQFEGKMVRALPVLAGPEGMNYFPRIVHHQKDLLEDFDGRNRILIGREMARYYGLRIGDRLRLYMPAQGLLREEGDVARGDFVIAGFFRTGFYEFDLNLILMSLRTAQRVLGLGNRTTEIVVQTRNLNEVRMQRRLLQDFLPATEYRIVTIEEEKGNFLAALKLERILMLIILGFLIVAGVAGIWVTSHLLVRSRENSIGMLKAMGLSSQSITIVFTANALLVGIMATSVGGVTGILAANQLESVIQMVEDLANALCVWFNQSCSPIQLIPRDIYYFDHLPVYLDMKIIFSIALVALVLSGVAGLIPARRAASLKVVETIRANV
ncbi:MAG: ABC transporter permease [Spirochaetales bacterium]|nr:ABC transporter permease [Spirochaetales bacterium]